MCRCLLRGIGVFLLVLSWERYSALADYPRVTFSHRGPAGFVRAMEFASSPPRLYVAGDDKVADVFLIQSDPVGRPQVTHAQTLRWEISRGERGRIYSMALSENRSRLLMGGYSARNSGGDLIWMNSNGGQILTALPGQFTYGRVNEPAVPDNCHMSAVKCLELSPNGSTALSVDSYGETRVWNVQSADRQEVNDSLVLKPAVEVQGAAGRNSHYDSRFPAVLLNDRTAITAEPADWKASSSDGNWVLYKSDFQIDRPDQIRKKVLVRDSGRVASLERNPSGTSWAAVFDSVTRRQTRLFVQAEGAQLTSLDLSKLQGSVVVFSSDNEIVLSGVSDGIPIIRIYECSRNGGSTRVVERAEFKEESDLQRSSVIAASADGRYFARYSRATRSVYVYTLKQLRSGASANPQQFRQRIRSQAANFKSVAFNSSGRAVLALSRSEGQEFDGGSADFYLETRSMMRRRSSRTKKMKWQPQSIVPGKPNGPAGYQVKTSGKSWSLVSPPEQGKVTALYQFRQGSNEFVATASLKTNGIYVYGLPVDSRTPVLLRYFRGHNDRVTGLSVSPDGTILASVSEDQTTRLWSLDGLPATNRFSTRSVTAARLGAELSGQTGLKLNSLHPHGILADRGFKPGATFAQLSYKRSLQDLRGAVARTANDMERAIAEASPESSLGVQLADRTVHWFKPAWEPLASLYVTATGEWVCCSPTGVFASSDADSSELLTFHQNRERTSTVKIASGRELSAICENARQLSRMIANTEQMVASETSVSSRKASRQALEAAFEGEAEIRLNQPTHGLLAKSGDTVEISATATLPSDSDPGDYHVDAYVNGRYLGARKLVDLSPDHKFTVSWNSTPTQETERVRVILKKVGDSQFKFDEVAFATELETPVPALYSLVLGSNDYEGDLPKLNFARQDAEAVHRMLNGLVLPGQASLNVLLTDKSSQRLSRETVSDAIASMRERVLSQNGPAQLVVFLAGHGVRSESTNEYYFLPTSVKKLSDVEQNGIAWSTFEALSDLPCQKVFIIDTCDSGAVLEEQTGVATAIGKFTDAQIVVIAATSESGTARELVNYGHGALTQCLIEGLSEGRADGVTESESLDRIITLRELADYIRTRLPDLTSEAHEVEQFPTIAPAELLNIQSIPLRRVEN